MELTRPTSCVKNGLQVACNELCDITLLCPFNPKRLHVGADSGKNIWTSRVFKF